MTNTIILAENLGKAYQIAAARRVGQYRTLQEEVVGLLRRPFARRNQSSRRETFWALRDISFEVREGEAVGIIGRNGAGKSTLLKILSRITRPTSGRAEIRGRVGSLLEVGTGFHPELTGRENIFLNGAILGMSRTEIKRRFDEIVDFAEVEQFLETPVKRYSSGMYMRLAFAVAAHLEPEILVIDEVLAVGDAKFQQKSLGKMGEVAKSGRTVLFVSHNLAAVQSLCPRTLWLNAGTIMALGNTDEVVSSYLNTGLAATVDQQYESVDTAPGNDRIRVKRMRVVPESLPITMTTPIKLEFEYWNLKPNTFLNVSLHIYSLENVMAFNTIPVHDAYWLQNPFPQGLFRTVCHVPGYLLNSGTYRVEVLFVEDQSRAIFMMNDALIFDVAEAPEVRGVATWFGKIPGIVHPRCEWETHAISVENDTVEKQNQ